MLSVAGPVYNQRYRTDGRCGPQFPAPGAPEFGECNPDADKDQEGPCCRPSTGWCGNVRGEEWGHCDCKDCIDFAAVKKQRQKYIVALKDEEKKQQEAAAEDAAAAADKAAAAADAAAALKPRYRTDGRCGPKFPAPGAPSFGECDPDADQDQKGPCCRPSSGWCGNVRDEEWGHCDCSDCIDFSRNPGAID